MFKLGLKSGGCSGEIAETNFRVNSDIAYKVFKSFNDFNDLQFPCAQIDCDPFYCQNLENIVKNLKHKKYRFDCIPVSNHLRANTSSQHIHFAYPIFSATLRDRRSKGIIRRFLLYC